jgi:hypothetical protein
MSFVSWSSDRWYHPLLWSTLIPGVVHLLGVWTLRLDINVNTSPSGEKRSLSEQFKDGFCLCSSQEQLRFQYKPDSIGFMAVSWLTAITTLAHYIYGTA